MTANLRPLRHEILFKRVLPVVSAIPHKVWNLEHLLACAFPTPMLVSGCKTSLRTEEPEPESDICIIRSRLPGALPKRRQRLAKPPAPPRAEFRRAERRTCPVLEHSSLTVTPTCRGNRPLGPSRTSLLRQCPERQLAPASAERQAPRGSLTAQRSCANPLATVDGDAAREPALRSGSTQESQTRSTSVVAA